jgi:hypothetical protein
LRLSLAALAILVLAAALAAPIVLHSGGSGKKGCPRVLVYRGRRYVARPVPSTQVVQAIAIGVGLARGCDAPPSNVDLRSLPGIKPTAAVGLAGDQSSVYVRRGVCSASSSRKLMRCLRASAFGS